LQRGGRYKFARRMIKAMGKDEYLYAMALRALFDGRNSVSISDSMILRRTFASHLVMKGVDLRTVAKLMGHRDISVTMRYAHLAPDHLQAAVDVLAQPIPVERQSAG
jgi:site-specific recombinase XerD